MKTRLVFQISPLNLIRMGLVIAVLSLEATCTPVTPGAQVTISGWTAQQYSVYSNAWASITNLTPLDKLGTPYAPVLLDGYITTDSTGQAQMRYGTTCTVYVFQNGSTGMAQETISTCTRGSTSTTCTNTSTTWFMQNCPGISAVTLPATITLEGTAVTIIEYRDPKTPDLAYVLVIVSEGTVLVTPTDPASPPFQVHAGKAAYAVTATFLPQAQAFFGFNAGEERDFIDIIGPIQQMDQARQAQSANLILLGQGLAHIPLPVPYQLGLRWLSPQHDDANISQGIAHLVDWNAIPPGALPKEIPIFFLTQGQTIDLRATPFDPALGISLLQNGSYPIDKGLVLAYDGSIPDGNDVASSIAAQLMGNAQISVTVRSFDPVDPGDVFAELLAGELPVLVLGGY